MLKKNNVVEFEESTKYGMVNYHVLESMADWVRVVDYDGNVLYANRSMKESLGEEILDMKCYRVHGNVQPCGFCISKRSIRTKETVQKEEIIKGRYFSIKSSPVFDEEGKVIAAVEVFRDTTRERKLEKELVDKNKKMSTDLVFAKRLQQRILPQKGIYKDLYVDHMYKPSELLSGDMYDVLNIDEDNIGIYICDVVGHGVTASMMTMFVRQTMRAIIVDELSPGRTLSILQERFKSLNLGMDKYFTIFYGVYNVKTKSFKYANAGHNCIPIKYNQKDTDIDEMKSKGYPISFLFDKVDYVEKNIQLKSGDEILFYTDGITEVKNFDGEEFGMEKLIGVIRENKSDVINSILYNVERYRWGEQEDDFAMLLIEIMDEKS